MIQKTYCTSSIFDEICNPNSNIDEYKTLFKILFEYSNIHLDISSELLKEKIDSEENYLFLAKREDGSTLESSEEFINNIKDQTFSDYPTEMFILDNIDSNFSAKIRNEIGTFIIAKDEINIIKKFNTSLGFKFKKENRSHKDWKEILNSKTLTPCNSAIIIDGYLLRKNKREYLKENLYIIIENIIPRNLNIDFQLSLVINNGNGDLTQEDAKRIIEDIEKSYQIKVEIIAHTNTRIHERALLTNHHRLYSDKGFCILLNDRVASSNETNGTSNWLYNNIENQIGTTEKENHYDYVSLIKKERGSIYGKNTETRFIAGNVNNRLLK